MINNFMCDNCRHYMVCSKLNTLMKFHETAKKDLMITLKMEECMDYEADPDEDADASDEDVE